VIATGGVLAAIGTALVPLAETGPALVLALAILGAAGAAAGGAPLLLGVVSQRVAVERRGLAAGIVSAGGSTGQLALAPLAAVAIASVGWVGAMYALAALALAAVPLARAFRAHPAQDGGDAHAQTSSHRAEIAAALRDPSYWFVTAGFFVCGFHVTFLTTHMPGVIELCGMPASLAGIWLAIVGACNVVGSVASGLAIQRWRMKSALVALYALRALGVAIFTFAPKTSAVMIGFALWMGLTYMATLPPTSGLIAQRFGARNVAALLGITMATHQLGSFLGAWLGGLEAESTGRYEWIWYADIALAVAAAVVNLAIREPKRATVACAARRGASISPARASGSPA
jgi:predicted MFS family arabinose efflux permease